MNGFKIVVLAKQVPDTRNVGKDAMKEDGTVNRAVLPAIFNPEDLNALELALQVKDKYPESVITVLTMGPPRAAEIIREGLYRGANNGILITDRKFAGSDTLATSYAISQAIKKIKDYDLIFAGRQAIDGDTAQVGPQVAEKLKIPQITYAEELKEINKDKIIIKRRLERGVETVSCQMPVLITVHSSADDCRPRHAKFLMKYKHARTNSELEENNELKDLINNREYLKITEWNVVDIEADITYLGLSGSPTKVKNIENIVLQSKEAKNLESTDQDLESFIIELIENHTIG
ncbi:MAG: electron transfer flavoprotein subunit beta/FixA family protein [Bacteroidales bacterium]|nr:electron transfer flavoprotein subunit beta/FixA family protein [Bacteroidales bacterium]MBN2756833.1 electron transfer flavoprotein subunit beta/FixA family protein [Bacteroidales bacterium]HES59228.1 electron transfer flavoprotein beta subunit/FixA family protein [Caldithrix sp.]